MSARECPATITITSQADILDGALAPCTGAQGFTHLIISTSAEGLGFANFTGGVNISVTASPLLQLLSFPDLVALQHLDIRDTPALTQISLPKLRARAETLVYPITYTFTPSLTITDALRFGGLSLPALAELGDLVLRHVPRRQVTSGGLGRITAARSISSDNSINYPGLSSVATLQLTGYEDGRFVFPNLSSVGDFTFTNALNCRLQTGSLAVSGSFVLDTATYRRADNETTFEFPASDPGPAPNNVIDIRNLTAVGANATIKSNSNARIDVSGLMTVGRTLSITNNTNCTIDVTRLSQTGTLSIVDNANSTIPQLFNLERAESIHLRGHIDTSSGPNILPSLTFVSGLVTIEAWNADFNCSRLLSQQQQGLINNLSCNGTTGAQSAPPSSSGASPSFSPGLSTGAWAGIGVGIGLVVIALLGGAAWTVVYFRRRVAALEASALQLAPPPADAERQFEPDASTLNDGSYAARDIHEADSAAKAEKPAYVEIEVTHEMYVQPAELPVTQPRWPRQR